jgi:putative ATP-binding cassette transporter
LTFREIKINIVTGLFAQVYGVIGIFLSLPRYFAKAISFGQVMQINAAFLKVVSPLLFFVYSYDQVAELRANVKRLLELNNQIDNTSNKTICCIDLVQKELLKVDDVVVYNNGIPLFEKVSFRLYPNDSMLIRGCVGSGKSTLLQVLKGRNKKFDGTVKYRTYPKVLFLSHKSYFSKDDFKRAVFNPILCNIPNDNDFMIILRFLGLEHLSRFIGKVFDWNSILSASEQQLLSFCRLYVGEYDLVILDEATSNIPVELIEKVYDLLKSKKISYISSSHTKSLEKYHKKEICL